MKSRLISCRVLLYVLLLALTVALVPLLLLAPYDVPCADDFNYGVEVYHAFRESGSFFAALRAASETAGLIYNAWQGSFSAVFLMALQPAVFGFSLYGLTPVLTLGMLIAGTFCFCICLFSRIFGLSRDFGACVAAALCLLSIELLPSPIQGFFWYNGSIYYTFFYGLLLLCLSLGILTVQEGGFWRIALLCLLCFGLGGGNYVTALNTSVLFVFALVLCVVFRQPGWKYLLVPLLFLLLSFGLSIAAPGNAVRQSASGPGLDALQAISASFVQGAHTAVESFSLAVLGGFLVLLVLFWHAAPQSTFPFRLPALVTLFSFCLYSALFTPTLYALGTVGAGRVQNIVFYAYLLLLALNVFYWVGWLRRRSEKKDAGLSFPLVQVVCATVLCLACCAGFILYGHGLTSIAALSHLRSGDAAHFHQEAEERLEILLDESERDVELEPYRVLPYLLYLDDITRNADDWRNQSVSAYFGKDSVKIRSK